MSDLQVSVVIPCYRTGQRVSRLVEEISKSLTEFTADSFEILMVVDGSPDDTWQQVQSAAHENKNVRGIELMRNYGQHAALLAGIRSARGEVVVTLDDDFQQNPAEIPSLIRALGDSYDLVYGVSTVEEHSALRNIASRSYKWLAEHMLQISNAKSVTAFRAFRRDLAAGFENTADPYAPLDVLLNWSTTRITSVPVRMNEREEGKSSYTFKSLVRHAINAVTGYSTTPLRFVTYVGLTTFLISFVLLARIFILYVYGDIRVVGYSSLAIMIAFFSGIQLLSLGIIGEYLGRLHMRSMGKPRYLIRTQTQSQQQ